MSGTALAVRDWSVAAWLFAAVAVGAVLGVAVAAKPVAAAALILAIGAGALLLRPALVPPVLVVTVFTEALTIGGLTVSRLAGPLAAVAILTRLAQRAAPRFPARSVMVLVAAYVAWAFASTIWTVNPDDSLGTGGTGFALASLGLSLVYLAACAVLVETRDDLRRLGTVIWAVAVAFGLVAIGQYLAGYDRALAYAGDANFFAALQVVALPICILVANRAPRGPRRAVAFAGIAVVVGSVLVSLSRGGLLALLGVILLISVQPVRGLFTSRAQKRVVLAVIALGAGALLYTAYDDVVARGESLFDTAEGGSGRENLWRAAITGWHANELAGLGYGAFPNESNDLLRRTPGVDFSAYRLRETGQVAHSAYLGTLVELGVVGLALLIGMLLAMLHAARAAARTADSRGDPMVAGAARALAISIAGFAVISLFLSTESDRSLWVMLGVSLAIARVAAQRKTGEESHAR